MRNRILTVIFLLLTQIIVAQEDSYYSETNKEKMRVFAGMIGSWKGEGWIINKNTRSKESFLQQEEIKFGLDSTIIQIRGTGTNQDSVIHDAFAVLSVEPDGQYFLTSFLGDGRSGKYEVIFKDDKIVWTIPVETGTVRYTIQINEGVWNEKGDFGIDGKWYPFFEMNLQKTN